MGIGSTHQLGSHRYVVLPLSDADTVWLQLEGTEIETPVSRALLHDSLIDIGPIMDRQIASYLAGEWISLPVDTIHD